MQPSQQTQAEFFKFPLSNEKIQAFTSVGHMKQTYLELFQQTYGSHPVIKWTFYFTRTRLWKECNFKYKQKLEQIWKMRCNICTNTIVYGRRQSMDDLVLLKVSYYHLHTMDPNKYMQYIRNNIKFTAILRVLDINNDNNPLGRNATEEGIMECMSNLPNSLHKLTKYWIIEKYFGISEHYFDQLFMKLSNKYEISFPQLLRKFQLRNYAISYLPTQLLKERSFQSRNQQNEFLRPQEIADNINPHLPNIILIVTPAMKQQYLKFGQLVGFDLTFSVVSQRTESNGEYMLGVFASSNSMKKIVVFGLVVTNSQSVFAYSFIFKSFFKIMGRQPQVIVTDEQKALYFSLRELKQEGLFTGNHLLDMFHMLRKFRKCSSQSVNFQLMRQLIHAKDRMQYRRIFKKLMESVMNDKELQLLRNFDMYSSSYCYSQIGHGFVGIGVSNSVNQFFHSLIKNQIPHATKLVKAVQIVLDLIDKRLAFSTIPVITKPSYEVTFNLPFMNPLRTALSDRVYGYIFKEITQSATQKIISFRELHHRLLRSQESFQYYQYHLYSKRNQFFIQTENGPFLVQKKQLKRQTQDQQKPQQSPKKWFCTCELQQRSGYFCSHIGKVLLQQQDHFWQNIHKRWILPPQSLKPIIEDDDSTLKLRKAYENKLYETKAVRIYHKNINGQNLMKDGKKGELIDFYGNPVLVAKEDSTSTMAEELGYFNRDSVPVKIEEPESKEQSSVVEVTTASTCEVKREEENNIDLVAEERSQGEKGIIPKSKSKRQIRRQQVRGVINTRGKNSA